MKKIIKRRSAVFVLVGLILILVFVVQNGMDSRSEGTSQLEPTASKTAAATTAAVVPSPHPGPTAVATMAVPATVVPTTAVPATTTAVPTTAVSTTAVLTTAVPLLPTQGNTTEPTANPQPTATPGFLTVTPGPSLTACSPALCIPRFGASGTLEMISAAYSAGLPFDNYFNWELENSPLPVGEAEFWQMIRVNEIGVRRDWDEIGQAVEANPESIWIIGNEPDIRWQDNTTPARYAEIYHDAYFFIKELDPSARIAVAGVGQPTPLRLSYLDLVLETYSETYGQPMPVDIWTIHNFILREERDSWGVGIPPGMIQESGQPIDQGILYEIEDHNDLEIFKQNLIDFRQWLADRGYRDRPLAVTEFGILMPSDFGFPPDVVVEFMRGTFEFLVQARDDSIGYPADDNRLVQWSFWYSVFDEDEFPTGNLYDPETAELTPLGEQYATYINGS